jgi:hypothetical protein
MRRLLTYNVLMKSGSEGIPKKLGVAEERDELGRDRDIPEFEIVQ